MGVAAGKEVYTELLQKKYTHLKITASTLMLLQIRCSYYCIDKLENFCF
jgi:hypothetical protein